MKCPHCGAEAGKGKFCEFCGSQLPLEVVREQEQLNKKGCPKCGSTNIVFNREKQGEAKLKKGTAVVRSTVGMCKDCGYTWQADESGVPSKKRKTWLWVLGWICIFPVPLTILMLRKKQMKPVLKYGIIALAWIVYLIIVIPGLSNNDKADTKDTEMPKTEITEQNDDNKADTKPTADNSKQNSNTKKTDEPAKEETKEPAKDESKEPEDTTTLTQKNALNSAKSYLAYTAFSHDGLVEQLEYEKFDHDDAVYAADNCGADWNEQALKSAKSYLAYTAFSHDGLVEQLEYEKFTTEEAEYGADNCGADWQEQALESAKSYLSYTAFSHDGLVEQLEYEKFDHDDAVYAADNCGADWNEQAVKSAQTYLKYSTFSRGSLIDQLEYEGFTNEQAVYAVDKIGL